MKKSKQKIEKVQRGEKNLFSKSIFQFALPLIPPPKLRNPVAWFQLLNFLHEICYIINQFSTELIYYFWFTQIIQCSEDDGKIETFMTIDRQFQTLEMESTIEGYQNVANLRYMKSNCMFDYLSWLWFVSSSRSKVFLRKGVLKICSRFTGEHPYRIVVSIKFQSNFVEITLQHGCSPVNLLHIFTTPFPRNTSGWLPNLFLMILSGNKKTQRTWF